MLIDDNEIDNLINQKMIEATGFAEKIVVYSGAKGAIEFLRNIEKLDTKHIPGLIFLDIDMPLMDGFQFLEEFQKLSDIIRESCRIVMLTSSNNPDDIKRSKSNSFVAAYLSKPLSQNALNDLKEELAEA
jgi:CheY-like chemotaxis protein